MHINEAKSSTVQRCQMRSGKDSRSGATSLEFRKIPAMAKVSLLSIAVLSSTLCFGSDRPIRSKRNPTEAAELSEWTRVARAYDWVETIHTATPDLNCQQLLSELKEPISIRKVQPRIEASSEADDTLGDLARCATFDSKARARAARPNSFIERPSDFGDGNFRLYRVVLNPKKRNVVDIIYGEFSDAKLLTNGYSDAYTIVDLNSCTKRNAVPVQRPLASDAGAAASRQFIHGVFEYKHHPVVISVTEQVGHLDDPASFRSINVWSVNASRQFEQSCAWSPRAIVK